MYFLSLLQLSIIVKLSMLSLIIILVLSIKSLFTLRFIYWRFAFVLSPGGGLNRRPVLFAYDPRGPWQAVYHPDAAGVIPGGPGFFDHTGGRFIVRVLCGIFSLNYSLTK